MTPEERISELERTVDTLTKYINVRGGVVQINAPMSIKGDIEFKGVRILSNIGSPSGSVTAPNGSIYLRTDGGSGTSLYTNYNGGTLWNDN